MENIELKPEQLEIIKSVIEGKYVFGLLPTGFGKSVTYIFVPLVLKRYLLCVFSFIRNLRSPAPISLYGIREVSRELSWMPNIVVF